MKTPFLSLGATLWIVFFIFPAINAQGCGDGWFGSLCQYQCHCTGNNCDKTTGDCINSAKCVKGWFGPQCQYVDLSFTHNDGTTKLEFRDADDATCNKVNTQSTAAMSFDRTYPFTWLRLHVKNENLLDNIEVTFDDGKGNTNIRCGNMQSAEVDSRTIDIHCDVSVEVKKVAIKGNAVGHLCSFYVSGGRNVALKQTATQSTTQGGGPERAVDGNTDQDNNKGGSCSHTGESTLVIPVWTVTFPQNNAVNRYVIYNRGDCCEKRLLEFTLTSRNNNGAGVFSYHDSGTTALSIYNITTATETSPVKSVNITTSHLDYATATSPILTLCEVEIYGDSLCGVGKYGRECEYECHCASNEECFASTGRCPNGCAVGYTGDTCNEPCPETFYGAGCQKRCSDKCVNRKCHSSTGICNQCPSGFMGDQCDQPCPATKHGPGCNSDCSINCRNKECNAVSGVCTACPSGKTGDLCNQVCPPKKYGPRCIYDCSTACVGQTCEGDTGNCDNCPAGKTGNKCEEDCPAGTYGPRCTSECLTCADNKKCDKVDGRCEECPLGKTGEKCTDDCPPKKHGARCIHACSTNCVRQLCDGVTGVCNQCPAGKNGTQCEKDCPLTHYGPRCVNLCSPNCANKTCEGDGGKCFDCPSGKTGDMCDGVCPTDKYGPRCIRDCSSNCLQRICEGATGHCKECIAGMLGDFCDRVCPDGQYGDGCMQNCSVNCKKSKQCDSVNGTCSDGCSNGYMGDLCIDTCTVGTYGPSCGFNCSDYCNTTGLTGNDTSCHHTDGDCLYGCDDKHEGFMCMEAIKQSVTGDTAPVGAIVGAILAVVVIVALIVVGVLFWRRRHNKKDGTGFFGNRKQSPKIDEKTGYTQPGNSRVDGNPYENVEIAAGTNQVKIAAPSAKYETAKTSETAKPDIKPKPAAKPKKEDDPATYYNTGNLGKSKSTSIPISQLQAFVAASSKEFFKKQFESIPDNKKATTKIAQNADNKQKNRYKNICAYDHSRVCLLADKDKSLGDYINANYIEGYNGEEKFIASQGPTKINMNDFIRMLWEQKVDKVVMLTNLVEEGKMKCEKYWPDDEKQWFGDIKMVLTTTEIFADYTIRRLNLKKEGEPVQPVIHFHFTSWPDKGVPTIPWGLVDFEQRVASYPTSKPIVVHCSAGVGRTGTFIALRNVMRQAEDTGYVDCFATVQNLRKNRVNMVQTAEQYEFLHRAAQVAMVCLGTTVTSADIQDRITKLESKTPTGQTLMEHEFAAICSVCADDGEADVKQEAAAADSTYVVYENSSVVANKLKDRLKNVPAKENYRAILARENDDMGDYINAVLVPSFRKLDQQILTQLPLPTTVTDFWRLVTQYKVALVVALAMGCDEKDSSVADYLPLNKDETMSVPLFKITSGSISRGDVSEIQQVTVEAVDVDVRRKSMPVFLNGQHHLTHVKYMSPDLNPKKLLDLIKQVREHFPGPEGRVVFLCRNGATYSGLMCVLTLLLDRMDNDLRLTVPLVVGAIKSIRPQVIPTLDQYKLLYQILHMYNESNNVYSNFGETTTPEKERRRVEEEQDKENAGIYANS